MDRKANKLRRWITLRSDRKELAKCKYKRQEAERTRDSLQPTFTFTIVYDVDDGGGDDDVNNHDDVNNCDDDNDDVDELHNLAESFCRILWPTN